jgi:hypothetical protein
MMGKSRQEWNDFVESRTPRKNLIVDRNRAITAQYALWYLGNPELFKWAGMAAFASRQVGLALAVSELMHAPGSFSASGTETGENIFTDPGNLLRQAAGALLYLPSLMHSFAARQLLLQDLDEVRRGNNGIFYDIAWAHAAFLEGGIDEIERNIEPGEEEYMLRGFRMIAEGSRKLSEDSGMEEARHLIREGNVLLLRHEQLRTLQPVFDALSPQGKMVVSFGSELDFPDLPDGAPGSKPSFSIHAGYIETLFGRKSITNSGDRWQWIEESVLPAWEKLDLTFGEGTPLKRRLEAFAASEPAIEHHVTAFARKILGMAGSQDPFSISASVHLQD